MDKDNVVDIELDSDSVSAEQKMRVAKAATTLTAKPFCFHLLPLPPQSKKLPRTPTNRSKRPKITYGSGCRTAKTAQKWFGVDGLFAGFNIGASLGGGSGMMMLDLDTNKEGKEDGIVTLKRWAEEAGETADIETTTATTPSDGLHLYFNYDPRLANKKGSDHAIDLQSGHPNKDMSHCVIPPSIVGGKAYTFVIPPEQHGVARMPEWLVQRLIREGYGVAPVAGGRPRGSGLGNELVTSADLEQVPSKEQVREMLRRVDPDMDYGSWFRVLPTIHHVFSLLGDLSGGLEVADEWSQRGKRYKPGEVSARWNKLNDPFYVPGPRGLCTSATLFRLAKEGGWEPKEGDKLGSPLAAALEEINRLYPAAKLGNKVRMINTTGDGALHPFNLPDVRFIYDDKKVPVGEDAKMVNPVEVWKGSRDRVLYEGVGLYPPPAPLPKDHLNLWAGWSVEPQAGDVTPFTVFVLEVICRGNERYCNWLLDWAADLFQEPGDKKGTAVVLRGDEGCGKGTWSTTLGSLMKPAQFCHFIDTDQFVSQFNGHVLSAALILADEAVWSGNHKSNSKLKGLVTEPRVMVQFKGVDTFGAPSCARVIIQTNEDWSVPAGKDSRRYFALRVSGHRIGDREYWNELHSWIDSHRGELLHYFQNRKITGDLRKALVTEELKEQRRITADRDMGLVDRIIFDMLHDGQATRVEAGDFAGCWVWTNSDMKERGFLLNDSRAVSSQIATSVGKTLRKMGLELEHGRSKKLSRFIVLPSTPAPLVEAAMKKFSLSEDEVEATVRWCSGTTVGYQKDHDQKGQEGGDR